VIPYIARELMKTRIAESGSAEPKSGAVLIRRRVCESKSWPFKPPHLLSGLLDSNTVIVTMELITRCLF
jgi:hypothetical protein